MHTRKIYLDRIKPFIGKPVIKIITGMRRAGKSVFLKQIIHHLKDQEKVEDRRICFINKESLAFETIRDYQSLNAHAKNFFTTKTGPRYLFVDEIQEITGWERAIGSLSNDGVDIYLTGSNAHLLSSELATLLSGRYIEFPMQTLCFDEFLLFRKADRSTAMKEFQNFFKFGGFPAIHEFDLSEESVYQYINSIYNTILLKDIVGRNNVRNIYLLENVMRFVCDHIGNVFSAKSVADYLKSQRLKIGVFTILNYLRYFTAAFAVHCVKRYDIKGRRQLETHEKYFLGDIGLRHASLGYRETDIAGLLENIVFLELKKRGYRVYIGKFGDREIDFIADRENRKMYLQVAYQLTTSATVEREIAPLLQVPDNYPKYLLTMDPLMGDEIDGIRRMNVVDFLLDSSV